MADISHRLKIKYGLGSDPGPRLVQQWHELTLSYLREGRDSEVAGDLAARRLFVDYRTRAFASEADTIETLLQQAGKK